MKKLDGTEFPGKTLYDIVICVQFYLETLGFSWKLLNNEAFTDVKFTLDNIMKMRTAAGIGTSVKKANFMSSSNEDYLWSLGFLGTHSPDVLLNTVVFIMGKGFALCAGKENQALRSPPFRSQFLSFHGNDGQIFIRYKGSFTLSDGNDKVDFLLATISLQVFIWSRFSDGSGNGKFSLFYST